MTLDRQRARELAQALLRARNMRDGSDILKNAAQASAAFGDRSYGEPMLRRMGFPSALLRTATGGKAGSQSQELLSTPRPLPFRDPARFSYVGEIADMAKARGIPGHDQLAFNEAPSASSRPATLQTTYRLPLAAAVGMGLQRLYPSYCPPTDNTLTFPPLINQDKAPLTEAEKDACHKQYDHDLEQCKNNYSYSREALGRCRNRAAIIRDLCLRSETETLPWNDVDEDGIRFPKPGKGRKRK